MLRLCVRLSNTPCVCTELSDNFDSDYLLPHNSVPELRGLKPLFHYLSHSLNCLFSWAILLVHLGIFSVLDLFIFDVYECFACLCVYISCVCLVCMHAGQKRVPDLLKRITEGFEAPCGCWESTQVVCKISSAQNCRIISSAYLRYLV